MYRHFLAGGGPVRPPVPSRQPETTSDRPPDFDLAHPSLAPLLEQLLRQELAWPVIGFELEANGFVVATAEAAWPEHRIALVAADFAADQEAFTQAGWRTWGFAPDGLSSEDVGALVALLASPP